MVADPQVSHYSTITRYTTSAFMRMKLGEALFSLTPRGGTRFRNTR
jgi:propionate CoA-transferase